MNTFQVIAAAALLLAGAQNAHARPVSYPGGWTVMQTNDDQESGLHIHYSPTATYSVGYKGMWMRDKEAQFHGLQLNILGKRWNQPQSQANFYIKSGAGLAYSDKGALSAELSPAAFTGISLDWENRRTFTSYENRVLYAGDIDKTFMQKARIGIAPYIGDYGDLHTWLMLEVRHTPNDRDEFTFTPLVRLFKGATLVEGGVTQRGEALFNLVIRF
ncbi:MAG: hypothetical protein GC134_05730 [Proteobacteria bacterium]|nr:hypothetical protein [Pseudomonadota bacterium]